MSKLPIVALIGRTNVGKSTLFNLLIEKPQALVSKLPGTTRDRNFANVFWRGKEFTLIDTGGLDLKYLPQTKIPKKLTQKIKKEDLIETNIVKQAQIALQQADLILLVVDGQVGLQIADRTVANILKKAKKPYLLVVNKIDKKSLEPNIYEFLKLGLGNPLSVSAASGSGSGDLLDQIVQKIKPPDRTPETESLKISIIGKPNVGKSSLLNAILGEERVIVSPFPFTTRETHDENFEYQGHSFTLIDTAGIRKRAKISPGLEKTGVAKSLANLKRTDIALLVVEVNKYLAKQDAHLSEQILKADCGLIIVANKWDLIKEKTTKTQDWFKNYFRKYFPYLTWAPIIFISAKTGFRVKRILKLALEIQQEQEKQISEKQLEILLKKIIKKHPPAQAQGKKHPYIYDLKQIAIKPPTFQLTVHPKAQIHSSYLKFIENQIREKFGFNGTPIKIQQRMLRK